ncbi:MAG: DUF4270 domain-containing protein [Bacteroidota bacterium]
MNSIINRIIILATFVCSLASCTEPDSIGMDLLGPDQPGVFYTDTFSLECSSIREDSLRSDEVTTAFNLAGSYADPVFGGTVAGFFSEVRLPNNNTTFTFGTSPVLDSVVLTLAYADYYGDTTTPMNFKVYELDDKMAIDSNYYTNDTVALKRLLFSNNVSIKPKDSVAVDGAKRAPHLRLKLDDTFGNDFLNAPSSSYLNNTAFIDYFNGIHVTADANSAAPQGVIASFNLLASMSKLTFYYKNGTDTTRRTANFEINSGCPRFNAFKHDFSIAQFGNIFPVSGNDKLYVQSMSGLKARIMIPNLRDLAADGPVAINKAELVIPVIENGTFKNHNALLLFGVDSLGKEAIIPDVLESPSYYGGSYDAIANAYKFNLNRYVQKLVSNPSLNDYGLSIVSSGGALNSFRTVVPGPATPTGEKIRLRVTYSKLN